jgi:hypothetical protein
MENNDEFFVFPDSLAGALTRFAERLGAAQSPTSASEELAALAEQWTALNLSAVGFARKVLESATRSGFIAGIKFSAAVAERGPAVSPDEFYPDSNTLLQSEVTKVVLEVKANLEEKGSEG